MRKEREVLFVADELTLMKAYSLATTGNFAATPSKAGAVAVGAALAPTLFMAVGAGNLFANLKKSIPDIDKKTILSAIQKLLGLGANIRHVPLSKASSVPLGMGQISRNNSFYISHPIKDDLYIPLQEYNKQLGKEKNNVFMELAAALGAKSIYLEDANFYNAKGKVETDFSVLKPAAIDIGINANFEKDGSIKKEIYSSFDKPRREPMIPANLQKWVDIDTDLSLMASHRLNNGLRSHHITLHFDDSLEGAADIAAAITGTNKGFGFKSSTRKHISSTWVFKVEYHSIDDE